MSYIKKDCWILVETDKNIDNKRYFSIYIEDEELFDVLEELQKIFARHKKVEISFYRYITEEGEEKEGFDITLKE
jgi:uncharacterized protein YlbG (UPF0298 family)